MVEVPDPWPKLARLFILEILGFPEALNGLKHGSKTEFPWEDDALMVNGPKLRFFFNYPSKSLQFEFKPTSNCDPLNMPPSFLLLN